MKTFVQPGNAMTVPAPYNVLSGEGAHAGSLFGVATETALSGIDVSLQLEGVVDLPNLTTDVVAIGDKLNWNTATKELQKATSTLDNVATAVGAAGNGVTTVRVKLTPV